MRINPRRMRKVILQVFSVPALLLSTVTFWMFQIDSGNNLKLIQQNARLNIFKQRDFFKSELTIVIGDLKFLAGLHSMADLLHSPTDLNVRQALASDFKLFAEQRERYDQVRFLDVDGMELVRVNYRDTAASITGQKGLQSKKKRYYFEDSIKLERGEVYISRLDLNVEHGEIERPFKPMLRLATPVYDIQGNKRGVVILNYLAEYLFSLLAQAGATTTSIGMILNQESYWLKGATPEEEWGFMLEDRWDKTMAKTYPEAWREIQQQERVQFTTDEGLFTFNTISPEHYTGRTEANQIDSKRSWKIVLHTPTSVLSENTLEIASRYIMAGILLLLGWGFASFYLGRSLVYREETQRRMSEKDERLQNIINSAFDGIITINERGIIETFNPAACKLFGYLEHEVIGNKVNMLMHSPDREYHDTYIQNFIETGKSKIMLQPTVVTAQRRDGNTFPLLIDVSAKNLGDHWMFTGICRDNTDHHELMEKLEVMTTTDALTSVYNRGYFNDRISFEFNRAKRYNTDLALIILNVNAFYAINALFGHQVGDAYLVKLAEILQNAAHESDVIIRFGGDEFMLILPQSSLEDAMELAERIRKDAFGIVVEGMDPSAEYSVSTGVASLLDSSASSVDELLAVINRALDSEKNRPR